MSKIERRDQCCLCGKTKEQVRKLIVGLHGAVCSDCIDLCNDILNNDGERPAAPAPLIAQKAGFLSTGKMPKPKEIVTFLDNYGMGPEYAERGASAAVYSHYKWINDR